MKKIFKNPIITFILGGIVFTTINATAAYVYTARDIDYTPTDSEWNVSNASEALSSLKNDLNTVNQNVSEYKSQITEALANKGVEVTNTSTMEEITSGITNMSGGKVDYDVLSNYNSTSNYTEVQDGHTTGHSFSVSDSALVATIRSGSGPSGVYWNANNTVTSTYYLDLTDYKYLYLKGTYDGHNYYTNTNITFFVINENGTKTTIPFWTSSGQTGNYAINMKLNMFLDISSFSGNYKIGFTINQSENVGLTTLTLNRIGLVKDFN